MWFVIHEDRSVEQFYDASPDELVKLIDRDKQVVIITFVKNY